MIRWLSLRGEVSSNWQVCRQVGEKFILADQFAPASGFPGAVQLTPDAPALHARISLDRMVQ